MGVAILLFAAPGLLHLELRLDGRALVSPSDPAVELDQRMREAFHLEDPFVVFVESNHPQGILRPETLARVRRLTVEIYKYPEIDRPKIMSLGSEGRDRLESLNYSPFLYPLPETEEELAALRVDIEAAAVLKGTLVATDYSGAVILVQVPPGVDRLELYERLRATIDQVGAGEDRVHLVGAPAAEALLGRHLLEDLAMLLPICGLLLSAALFWAFRRPWPILLVMAEVGACLTFTFGLMGWFGQPVFLTTAVLPIALAALGLTDEIHLLVAAQRQIRLNPTLNGQALAKAVANEMYRPISMTSATTAIGFLSFLASSLPPVRAFGLWAGVGVLFCLVWSLGVTPVLMRRLGPQRLDPGARKLELGGLMSQLVNASQQRSVRLLAGFVLLSTTLGILRIEVQDGWISGFAEGSPFRQSTELVNQSILGTHLLQLHVTFEPLPEGDETPPAFHDPQVMEAIGNLEAALRSDLQIGGVLGPYSNMATTHYLASGRLEDAYRSPEDPVRLRQMWRRMELGRGPHRRQQVVTDAMDQGLITVFLKEADYQSTRQVMEQVRDLERTLLEPLGGRLSFAGDVAVSQAMIASIVAGQLRSVGFALIGILLFLWVALRRVKKALWATLPVTVACLAALGFMGWLNVPLGVATSMFIAITLGVGVDFPLHLMAAIDRQRGLRHPEPVAAGQALVGPAIVIDTVVVTVGFGLLVFSQVPANARLGGLVAVSILVSSGCTLLPLGARRFSRDPGSDPATPKPRNI